MDKYLSTINTTIDPDTYLSRDGGADSTTDTDLLFSPYEGDFFSKTTDSFIYGSRTSMTSPFTLDDVIGAMRDDNMAVLKKKIGYKANDFIRKIFNIKKSPIDEVQIVSFHRQSLANQEVIQTSNDNQGKIVSKLFGITPNNSGANYRATFSEFGILMTLCYITVQGLVYNKGIANELLNEKHSFDFQYYHPECVGMGYQNGNKKDK